MKICILNGSPKGELSMSLQYVHFIEKKFGEHEYSYHHVSKQINSLEKDENAMQKVIEDVRNADLILWNFGLWVLVVPAQFMRFIELIKEYDVIDAFAGKYTAVLSTSIHYYDHTAHEYMKAVCDDLQMNFIDNISFHMHDLLKDTGQQNLIDFSRYIFDATKNKMFTPKNYNRIDISNYKYKEGIIAQTIDAENKKIVLLTDEYGSNSNLTIMIDVFSKAVNNNITIININDTPMKGGCIGCMRCGSDFVCKTYREGFMEFYNREIVTADIVIFAGSIKDRFLSSRWKMFFDRAFFWNHTPSLYKKQIGYIISGPMRQMPYLKQILIGNVLRQKSNFISIVTDEHEDDNEITNQLIDLAAKSVSFSKKGYIKPEDFMGIGGWAIFRDEIWGHIRMVWQADHKYFKENKLYNFPHKNYKSRIKNSVVMLLTKIPKIKKKFYSNARELSIKQLKKVVEEQ